MEFYSTFAFKEKAKPFDNEGVEFPWAQIGEGHSNPSQTKSTQLRDPLYRYIHRVLSNSLCQRHDSTGVVGLRDLLVQHCIHNHVPLDVPRLLLRNMHWNQLANPPTPILFGGWIYRLFKNFVQRMPRSFKKGPWSGNVDLIICRSMDGSRAVWNPQEAPVLHAPQIRPPPQYQYQHHGDPGQSSSQGGGFPNFQILHDLLQENLMCICNTYNMARNTYTRVGVIERNISDMQDDISNIQEYMAGQGGDDEDEDDDMD
ncbi:hypothetical protein Hanom_Chr07g00643841 [Helianthus anomalus]